MKFPTLLILASAALAQDALKAPAAKEPTLFKPSVLSAPFLEQFTSGWDLRWTKSSARKTVDGEEDEALLRYVGKWAVQGLKKALIGADEGLVLMDAAAHSAISALFDKPIDPKGKTLVVQYEVNPQAGLDCGGAYLKLFTYDPKFAPEAMIDSTPYTIMFGIHLSYLGPDKCGANNKVHFIFRHQNPISLKWEEKHLETAPVSGLDDYKWSLYTLVIKPDQSFEIFVNNKSVSKGSLLESFTPPVNPPAEVDDVTDEKPADWVDQEMMDDEAASKPDSWDEDAPKMIEDSTEVKPADWLDDAPATIPDPSVTMPEDWDVEEDGDWTAPSIPNPACEASGCGPWKAPMINNGLYKGKWVRPQLKNPEYKGVWAPRKIANPDYFEDKSPADLSKIGAVGFELWSMKNELMFDNIYIGHSVQDAAALAKESWVIKSELEAASEPAPPVTEPVLSENAIIRQAQLYIQMARVYVEELFNETLEFIDSARVDPLGAAQETPHIALMLGALVILPLFLISLLFGSPKKTGKKEKAQKKEEAKAAAPAKKESPKKETAKKA